MCAIKNKASDFTIHLAASLPPDQTSDQSAPSTGSPLCEEEAHVKRLYLHVTDQRWELWRCLILAALMGGSRALFPKCHAEPAGIMATQQAEAQSSNMTAIFLAGLSMCAQ